jgi:hypothetical protein
VFVKSPRLNLVFSTAFVIAMGAAGACSGGGLGCGCTSLPLPPGGLPVDQTVEGGAQVRITPAGMTKVNQLIQQTLLGAFGDGFCVERGDVGGTCLGFDYCDNAVGGACAPGVQGCDVNVNVDYLNISPVSTTTLNVQTSVDLSSAVHLDGSAVCIPFSCTLGVDMQNIVLDADLALGIDPADGELTINLVGVNNTDFSNVNFSGCSVLSDIIDLVFDVLDSFIGDLLIDLFTPTLNDLVQGFLPDPLGVAGMIDLGAMLEGTSPGTEALMEGRFVPGGYVSLNGGGMTLGIITGVNADEDINSRTPDLDSEPALCVPPFAAPNFALPPASLPQSSRGTFTLLAAGAFSGQPDPSGDIALGMSETTLDLFGHHMVTSGGMCLGIGSQFAPQLNVGTIGLLVQSLSTHGSDSGNDPLLLVTRPQHPLDFTVGDGASSPLLTVHIDSLEVDFYAFLYERFTRVFTLELSLDAGVNFTVDNSAVPPTLTPVLSGLEADDIELHVINSEFVKEAASDLEAVLPTVLDLALPMIADGIGPIDMPDFGGFSLNNIALSKVTTPQDDFLAINATMGASMAMRQNPRLQAYVADLDQSVGYVAVEASTGSARLASVVTPPPADVVAALKTAHSPLGSAGAMPTVTIDTDAFDVHGRPLEWSWRLNDGMWRPFTTTSPLVIADRAFAWQGKYTVGLRSRVVDDTRTESRDIIDIPVIIDSVPPEVIADEIRWAGDTLIVPARDLVTSALDLRWAYAHPGADGPQTEWMPTEEVARTVVEPLIVADEVQVFVQDEAGNVTIYLARPFHGQAGEGGCNCDATGGPNGGSIVIILVTGALLFVRRRHLRRASAMIVRVAPVAGLWLGMSAAMSLVPGCSCGSQPSEQACDNTDDDGDGIPDDCADFCSGGDIAFCIDGFCVCSDDIPAGRIGPYSDVTGSPQGTAYVSAYAASHGDLVVAQVDTAGRILDTQWEWVDGVPDGPVEVPGAMIRGGISQAGENVGMYTSIAVGIDGSPMVTYFDRDSGSLKFAQKVGGVWQKTVIEAGVGPIEVEGGMVTGMYTSLSARTDDGRPGVAYLRHLNVAGTVTAEVRWASAQSATPTGPGDWTFWTIDSALVPPADPENPDVFPLPGGLGLFVDASRGPDQAPTVVYYDRANGDLKYAKFDATGGTFQTPVILDGASGGDAGWSPSVGIDANGIAHVAYVGATQDDLSYIRSDAPSTIETIDNGYRIVGTTEDGLPKPEFHFVGDDATMVITPSGPTVAYQDATTHELLLAQRNPVTGWNHVTIAGAEDPFVGAFGFFASASTTPSELVISTWVLDLPNEDQWVEVFRREFQVQ